MVLGSEHVLTAGLPAAQMLFLMFVVEIRTRIKPDLLVKGLLLILLTVVTVVLFSLKTYHWTSLHGALLEDIKCLYLVQTRTSFLITQPKIGIFVRPVHLWLWTVVSNGWDLILPTALPYPSGWTSGNYYSCGWPGFHMLRVNGSAF